MIVGSHSLAARKSGWCNYSLLAAPDVSACQCFTLQALLTASKHYHFAPVSYLMLFCTLLMCAAGIANCLLGVILMHDLKNAALVAWLTPICVLLGLLVLAGLVLEVPKRTVSSVTCQAVPVTCVMVTQQHV
jgi:hypothetical protein